MTPAWLRWLLCTCLLAPGATPALAGPAGQDAAMDAMAAETGDTPGQDLPRTGLPATPTPGAATAGTAFPVELWADRLEGVDGDWIEATGDARMRRGNDLLCGERLRYREVDGVATGSGNVFLRRGADSLSGPEGSVNLDTGEGWLRDPVYRLGDGARGQARRLEMLGDDRYRAEEGSYTTCAPGQDAWFIEATGLDLDRNTQIGTATHARVRFQGTPILYLPWMTFSLNRERKSGLLAPTLGSTGNSGFEVISPYYWNIAPNYDATFTPRLLTKRGLMLGGEFRYLQPRRSGILRADYLPDDRVANANRHAVSFQHYESLPLGLWANINYEEVSDDNYYRDLSTRLALTSQTHLPQEINLGWNLPYLTTLFRYQRYQTLQDAYQSVWVPYDREPQFKADFFRPAWGPLDVEAGFEHTHFRHDSMVSGKRTLLKPAVALNLANSYAFIKPRVAWHHASYDLDATNVTAPGGDAPDRLSVGTFSLDSGLFFERDTHMYGRRLIQTLEPRAYYVHTPFEDQSGLPNFDTSLADLNVTTLFTPNRFAGGDRVSDANQLTLAVSSAFIDAESGAEYLRLGVGQRYYFEDRRVTLWGPPDNATQSDLVLVARGSVAPHWTVDAGMLWDAAENRANRVDLHAGYRPGAGRILNVGYRLLENTPDQAWQEPLHQADISAQWPLWGNWHGVGRWYYSIEDEKILEGVAGLEYDGGCWAARLVAHRIATGVDTETNAVFMQLELNGIGRIGSNPLDVLRQNILGYRKVNEGT